MEDKSGIRSPGHEREVHPVGAGLLKKSEDELNGWFEPIFYKSFKTTVNGGFGYDVNVYFIPMFTGIQCGRYRYGRPKEKVLKVDLQLLP